jgi:hypothetical protein
MEPITRANALWKALVANRLVGIGAIVACIVGLFTITEQIRKFMLSAWQMLHKRIERHRAERIVDFLAGQKNPESQISDAHGLTPPTHLSRRSLEIGMALNLKPRRVLHLLWQLKEQHRVEQQGVIDSWKISRHELENRNWRKKK